MALVIAAVTAGGKRPLAIDKIVPVLEHDTPGCRSIDTGLLECMLHQGIAIEVDEHFGLQRSTLT